MDQEGRSCGKGGEVPYLGIKDRLTDGVATMAAKLDELAAKTTPDDADVATMAKTIKAMRRDLEALENELMKD